MKKFKYLFLLAASVMFFACSSGGDVPANEEPQPEDEPKIEVEELPAGVEIGDETVQLNNIQLQEVVNVDADNSTLTFDASLPEEQIPQKGQIILQYSPTDELPYGFLGRVTNIKKSGDKIIVETEVPALDEAFDEFVINYDSKSAYAGSRADDEVGIDNDITIDEEGYINLVTTISAENPDVACAVSFGLNPKINTIIDNNKNINNQHYTFGIKASTDITYSESASLEVDNSRDIGKGFKFAIPYLSPAVEGAIQFSWATEAIGEFEFTSSLSNSISAVFHVEANGNGVPQLSQDQPSANVSVEYNPEFKFHGEMFAGLGYRVELRLFGRKELSVGIGNEVGPRVATEVDLLTDKTNLYTQHKDTFVELQGVLKTKAYAQAKLFGYDKEWNNDIVKPWVFWETKKYIFPEFKDLSLDDSDKAYCSATLERDVLFPMGVGFSRYDKDNSLIEHSQTTSYYSAIDFTNPLTAEFMHSDGDNYWTYVKWGDKYIKCVKLSTFSIVGEWYLLKDEYYERLGSDYEHYIVEYIDGQYRVYDDNNGKIEENFVSMDMDVYKFLDDGTHARNNWSGCKYEINEDIISIMEYEPEPPYSVDRYDYTINIIDNNNIILYREEKSEFGFYAYEKITLKRCP